MIKVYFFAPFAYFSFLTLSPRVLLLSFSFFSFLMFVSCFFIFCCYRFIPLWTMQPCVFSMVNMAVLYSGFACVGVHFISLYTLHPPPSASLSLSVCPPPSLVYFFNLAVRNSRTNRAVECLT